MESQAPAAPPVDEALAEARWDLEPLIDGEGAGGVGVRPRAFASMPFTPSGGGLPGLRPPRRRVRECGVAARELLIAAGAHPKAIQEHLGHRDIQRCLARRAELPTTAFLSSAFAGPYR